MIASTTEMVVDSPLVSGDALVSFFSVVDDVDDDSPRTLHTKPMLLSFSNRSGVKKELKLQK